MDRYQGKSKALTPRSLRDIEHAKSAHRRSNTIDYRESDDMEQYLTAKELAERIKMAPGTIRNLVWRKEFQENIHFLKPTPRKLLFIWSAVEAWLHGDRVGLHEAQRGNDNCLIVL